MARRIGAVLRRLALACGAGAGLGLALAAPAAAATITGAYTGTITSVDAPLAGYFALNTPFTFNFSYDDTAIDRNGGNPASGVYLDLAQGSGTVGAFVFGKPSNRGSQVNIIDGALGDRMVIAISSDPSAVLNGYVPSSAAVVLDGPASVFSNDHLPNAYLSTALFDSGTFTLVFIGSGVANVRGTLTMLPAPTVTPIPAALPLFLAALASLGVAGYRRRRASPGWSAAASAKA